MIENDLQKNTMREFSPISTKKIPTKKVPIGKTAKFCNTKGSLGKSQTKVVPFWKIYLLFVEKLYIRKKFKISH